MTDYRQLIGTLSEKQLAVLRLLSAGKSAEEIADSLTQSVHTVKQHLRDTFAKLGVHNRAHAVIIYLGSHHETEIEKLQQEVRRAAAAPSVGEEAILRQISQLRSEVTELIRCIRLRVPRAAREGVQVSRDRAV